MDADRRRTSAILRRLALSWRGRAADSYVAEALLERAEVTTVAARRHAERHRRRARELTDQQHKLVELYYEDGVSKEVLQEQQARLTSEQAAAEQLASAADVQSREVEQAVSDALLLVDQRRAPTSAAPRPRNV